MGRVLGKKEEFRMEVRLEIVVRSGNGCGAR